jgi:hypothetical protein
MPSSPALLSSDFITKNFSMQATRPRQNPSYVWLMGLGVQSQVRRQYHVPALSSYPGRRMGCLFLCPPCHCFSDSYPSDLRRHLARSSSVLGTQSRLALLCGAIDRSAKKPNPEGSAFCCEVLEVSIIDGRYLPVAPAAESAKAPWRPAPQAPLLSTSAAWSPAQSPGPHPSAPPNSASSRS